MQKNPHFFPVKKPVAQRSFALLVPLLHLQCLQPCASHFQPYLCFWSLILPLCNSWETKVGVATVSGSLQENLLFEDSLQSLLTLQAYNRCEITGGIFTSLSRKMENIVKHNLFRPSAFHFLSEILCLFFVLVLPNIYSVCEFNRVSTVTATSVKVCHL